MKKPCKLLFSLLVSFSFMCVCVFADEAYPVITSYTDNPSWNYISPLKTENDNWDYLIQVIDEKLATFTYDNVLIGFDGNNINLYTGITASGAKTYWAYDVIAGTWINQAVTYINERNGILAMENVPILTYNSNFADFQNYNAVTWAEAKEAYSTGKYAEIIEAINNQTSVIQYGDSSDRQTVSEAESANDSLTTAIDEYDLIEQQYIDDFNTNLDNIDVSGFQWDSSFPLTAMWITTQFNRLVMDTPVESLVTFSLIIGICLYLIGRYKGL